MSEAEKKTATKAAVEVMEKPEEDERDDSYLIELSTGVILRAKPMPPGTFMDLSVALPRPEMPKFQPKGKDFFVQNPNDEDYVERVKAWEQEKNTLMLKGMIGKGTVYESGPPDWKKKEPPFMDDDWIDELLAISEKLPMQPENKYWRYLQWVLNVACETEEDYENIFRKVGRLSGVPEDDIEKAGNFS